MLHRFTTTVFLFGFISFAISIESLHADLAGFVEEKVDKEGKEARVYTSKTNAPNVKEEVNRQFRQDAQRYILSGVDYQVVHETVVSPNAPLPSDEPDGTVAHFTPKTTKVTEYRDIDPGEFDRIESDFGTTVIVEERTALVPGEPNIQVQPPIAVTCKDEPPTGSSLPSSTSFEYTSGNHTFSGGLSSPGGNLGSRLGARVYDVRLPPSECRYLSKKLHKKYASFKTPQDFAKACAGSIQAANDSLGHLCKADRIQLLHDFRMHQFKPYCRWLQTFPEYDEFMLRLHKKLKEDRDFADAVSDIQGFENHYRWGKVGYFHGITSSKDVFGFHEYIKEEAHYIEHKHGKQCSNENCKLSKQAASHYNDAVYRPAAATSSIVDLIRRKENDPLARQKEQKCADELYKKFAQAAPHGTSRELAELGMDMLDDLYHLIACNAPDIERQTLLRRAACLEQALHSPNSPVAHLPQLAARAAGLFEELGIDSHRYQRKANRAVDSIVLAEGIDCANIIAGLDQLDYALLDSDYLGTLTLLLVDEAQELCSKDEFEEAFIRQDEANCFTRFLHSYGKLLVEENHALEQMGEHVAAGGAMIARGVSRGVLNCVQNCAALASKLVTNPSQAACDLVYYRFYVPIALSNILLRAVTDRDGLWKDGTQLYESVRSYLENTPGMQMAEDGITFLTEAIIFGMLRSKGKQCFGVLKEKAKNIKVVVALQHKVSEQVSKGNQIVANAVAPVKKVFEDTKERVCEGFKKGKQKVSSLWRHKSDRFRDAKSVSARRVLEKHRKMPFVNWRHIFHGDRRKRNLGGYHAKGPYGGRIMKIIKGPDSNGVYEATFLLPNGKPKSSSFFPDSWSRAKTGKKLKEAYNNIVSIGENICIGKTEEGILIKFCFMQSNITNEIFINSAFPLFKG